MWKNFLIYLAFGVILTIVDMAVDRRVKKYPKKKRITIKTIVFIVTLAIVTGLYTIILIKRRKYYQYHKNCKRVSCGIIFVGIGILVYLCKL